MMSTDQYPPAMAEPMPTGPTLTPNHVPPYTCIECRARNLRCEFHDGADGRQACSSCQRFGIACSGVTSGSSAQLRSTAAAAAAAAAAASSAKLDRRRIQRACQFCRKIRSRCPGGNPCEPCRKRNQVCEYASTVRQYRPGERSQNGDDPDLPSYDIPGENHLLDASPLGGLQPGQIYQAPATAPISNSTPEMADDFCLGLDKEIVEQYIEAFFKFVYHTPCMSFLHQATFLRQWHTRTVQLSLLKAVCSCALRTFTTGSEDSDRAADWMSEVELDALHNLEDLSVPRLQVLVLLAFYHFTFEVHSKKVLMFSGLAARLAFAKRLNYENEALSIVEQESRRRLMWSIFMLDRFCSGGLAEMTLCPSEYMHIRLPGNERYFAHGLRTETHYLDTPIQSGGGKDMGEFAYIIRLLDILRTKIHRYNKRVASGNDDLYSSEQEMQAIAAEVDSIEQRIPADLKWTKNNLSIRVYPLELTSFIMLYTWLHQCKCDLYRLTIPGTKTCVSEEILQRTPYEYTQNLRSRCLAKAIDLTSIWADVLDLGLERPVNDPAVAGCAHQCAQILTSVTEQSAPAPEFPGPEVRMNALQICERIIEPLKDIYPKARILYDDVCEMRAAFNAGQTQGFPGNLPRSITPAQNNLGGAQSHNEEQVRSILGQFNG